MDFDARASKLETEAVARRAAAKKKLEEEARQQERQKERVARQQEELAKRKQEEEAAAEAEEARRRRELKLTGGVNLELHGLVPYVLEDAEDDKVVLSESALQTLTQQDAIGKGVMQFRLSSSKLHTTHCGVREFSAPENMIGLPRKVIESLLQQHQPPSVTTEALVGMLGAVSIKYIRLPKAAWARLQPFSNLFSTAVRDNVKPALEQSLQLHSTLTKGDLITIWYRGTAHVLRVIAVKSAAAAAAAAADEEEIDRDSEEEGGACSLFDTDVVVDLDVSLEFQGQEEQQQQQKLSQHVLAPQAAAASSTSTASAPAPAPVMDKESMRLARLAALGAKR